MDTARLDEMDADEFFEISRALNPAMTREQFDADWVEFQAEKRRRSANA